jgi:hypothetical protein
MTIAYFLRVFENETVVPIFGPNPRARIALFMRGKLQSARVLPDHSHNIFCLWDSFPIPTRSGVWNFTQANHFTYIRKIVSIQLARALEASFVLSSCLNADAPPFNGLNYGKKYRRQ